MAVLPTTRIYEGTRIPQPVPTILEVDPEKHRLDDILRVNFGPNHPSTHGVLRLVVDLDGETVAGIRAVIGYLHTGFEKNMEHKSWWKSVTYAPRIDYVSFHANELAVRARDREAARDRGAAPRDLGAHGAGRAQPHPLAPRLARHLGARARGDLAVLVLLRRPRRDPRPLRDGRRDADAHALRPGRRHRRGPAAGLHGRGAEVLRVDAEVGRRVRGDPRPQRDLARAHEGRRAALGRRRARARAVRADAALDRRRLGPAARHAVPRLRRGRVRRARSTTAATSTTATACTWTRCASRCASSASASTGSTRRTASRGSPTTARSCSRRGTSSTPRWSRSSTTSRSSPRASRCPRARSTSRSSRRAARTAATSSRTAARGRGA